MTDPRSEARSLSLGWGLFLSVVLLAALAAQNPAAQNRPSPGMQMQMQMADLRTRLYAISQMIQTGRLDEAEASLTSLRTEAGSQPLIDGMDAFLLYRRHSFGAAREI